MLFKRESIMKRKKSCWECFYFFYDGIGNDGKCDNLESEHYADRIHKDRSCKSFWPRYGKRKDFYDDDEG